MPPLTDPERFRCYRIALSDWRCSNVVVFEKLAANWLRANLPCSYGERQVARMLHDFVAAGGEIAEVPRRAKMAQTFTPIITTFGYGRRPPRLL